MLEQVRSDHEHSLLVGLQPSSLMHMPSNLFAHTLGRLLLLAAEPDARFRRGWILVPGLVSTISPDAAADDTVRIIESGLSAGARSKEWFVVVARLWLTARSGVVRKDGMTRMETLSNRGFSYKVDARH
jgi:hypothetical protein